MEPMWKLQARAQPPNNTVINSPLVVTIGKHNDFSFLFRKIRCIIMCFGYNDNKHFKLDL